MKTWLQIILLILATSNLVAQSNDYVLPGKYITFKDNGDSVTYSKADINSENPKMFYEEGLLCVYYDKAGKKLMMAMKVGRFGIEGEKLTFFENGTLSTIVNYKKGKMEGYTYFFGKNEKLVGIRLYKRDKIKWEKKYD